MGHTPAAWRRAQETEGDGTRVVPLAKGNRSPLRERQPEHEYESRV
jgi:hypothetical protein